MTLVVCPLVEAEATIGLWRPSHAICFASPGAETASVAPAIERLQLTFHDIVDPQDGLQAVSVDDVNRLLAFANAWPRKAPLLLQCWAGVSRSPAAAFIVACSFSERGLEREVAGRLRHAAPFATPNRRMVALADTLLGRDGAMTTAIEEIGRGADTSLGQTFSLF